MIDLDGNVGQREFGEIVGISQPAVSDLVSRGVIDSGGTLGEWILMYCGHLREVAAGRASSDLSAARAALAHAQREKIEMQNAVTKAELTPTIVLEQVLAGAATSIAGVLDAIPGMVKRRVPQLEAGHIEMIAAEIAKARNTIASMSIADIADQDEGQKPIQPPEDDDHGSD